MATRVITVDDIDGYEGEDVIRRDFQIGSMTFAIDLGDANHKRLQDVLAELAPYLEKATEVKRAGRARKGTADAGPRLRGYSNTDVREWAEREGVEISTRGKIADEVYEQFIAAHPDARPEA
ncbi:Lsr2 family protein [Actinomadura craniellae]|uniref:Lsr2 family protein n=1 Tax=Actinomadura craniellae TaxID=2231787 RepID=A0A365H6D7_9ACTN|nr:Lsr2 family protein [Actinomadura craniellae]RAY13813.1 Lsr2 family protein [Actinomadura craniellae]